jgi:hypothetical protein
MGGLRWKGAAVTAAVVAVIVSCSLVGLLVMGPAFRAYTDPAPARGDALAERAAGECSINGAVFVRSFATTCQSSPRERAAAGVARRRRAVVPSGFTAVLARKRRTQAAVADKPVRPASRGLVAPAPTGHGDLSVAPSPAPVAPTAVVPVPMAPVPTPVDPPVVVPPLDPLLRPADDGSLVDVDLDVVDVGLELGLGL